MSSVFTGGGGIQDKILVKQELCGYKLGASRGDERAGIDSSLAFSEGAWPRAEDVAWLVERFTSVQERLDSSPSVA